jgi:TRAP-type C4-dicarboxylate transport system permease small subunit
VQRTAPSLRRRVESLVAGLDLAMGLTGGALFFVCAWYIVFDVIGRNYGGPYSGATDEISGYALAVGTTWGMAFTLRRKGHVVIDVVTSRLAARWQGLLEALALAVMMLFASLLAFYSWRMAAGSWAVGARSVGIIATPLAWPQSLMAIGFTVLALEALVLLVGALAALAAGRGQSADAGRGDGTAR